MPDSETVGLMIVLFSMNYAALWAVYNKLNRFTRIMAIMCREHAVNHGGTELKYD
jgi:hypothetical protein